jgi:hypothetical protein
MKVDNAAKPVMKTKNLTPTRVDSGKTKIMKKLTLKACCALAAILWAGSAQAQIPTIVQDISPTNIFYLYVGQGVTLSASFSGSQPITYRWQYATDASTWGDIPGATNTTFTIPSAAPGNAGFYQLLASNVIGSTPSTYTYLQVNAGSPKYIWSAPIPFAGLNADQILTNFPGTYIAGALVAQSGGSPITVANSSADSPIVFAGAGAWASLSGGVGYFTGANTNLTGNANFNSCLNDAYTNNATHAITMSGLIVGKQYQVQLFALDNRGGLSPAAANRYMNWQDPADATDTSENYTMADNVYFLGTFTASSNVMTIQQNMLDNTNGNFNCLVLRAVGWTPPPYFTSQPVDRVAYIGNSLTLSGLAAGDPTVPSPTIAYQWAAGPAGGPYTPLVGGAKYAGTQTTNLTINTLVAGDGTPVYVLIASNGVSPNGRSQNSREVTLLVQPRTLVGEWLNNVGAGLGDVSGFSLAANHGAYTVGNANILFTNDVPPGKTGASLYFSTADSGLAISNSSTLDANYDKTFDNAIQNAFTVSVWGRGFPAGWNPFVSKWGEGPPYNTPNGGWQMRAEGDGQHADFTVRDNNAGGLVFGKAGDALDDMTTTIPSNDSGWHLYTGTFNADTGVRSLYVDSVLAAQETNNVAYDLAAWAHLCIGAKESPATTGLPATTFGNYSITKIYDVRIYNYDLTQGEIVTNLYGAVPAVVTRQPVSVGSFTNQSATVSAYVGGTQPIKYQWQLNGVNIQSLADSANFTGANSNILTIVHVTPNDAGSYQLIASNVILGVTYTVASSNALLYILETTLVGQWFAGGTNFADVSGYTPGGIHDGYTVGSVNYSFTNDVPPFRTGYSIRFPTSNTGIAISNSATVDASYTNTFDPSEFSVAFWAKDRGPGGSPWIAWVSKDGYNNDGEYNGLGWSVGIEAWSQHLYYDLDGIDNGATVYTLGDGLWGNTVMESSPQAIPSDDTTWHHYAATYSPVTRMRNLYMDGVLVGQQTNLAASYAFAANKHLVIGGQEQTTAGFTGFARAYIYDVRIYNYALTQGEISQLNVVPASSPAQIFTQPAALAMTTNGYAAVNVAYVGVTVPINASVGGGAPLTNQWQFNGTNLVDGTRPDGAVISGSMTIVQASGFSVAALKIANVTSNEQGVYTLIVANAYGWVVSSNVVLTVGTNSVAPAPAGSLIGQWLNGTSSLADTSGYSPAGLCDAIVQSGATIWTNDVPPIAPPGSHSLFFNNAGLTITNSSTLDANYTNTFDLAISNSMTVECWAKGYPGGWNPWVSKYGENSIGWQLRVDGWNTPCYTVRAASGGGDMGAPNTSNDGFWHHYAGTYDVTSGLMHLYVDGTLVVTWANVGQYALSPASHLMIGGRDGGGNVFGNYFAGEIYGVKIYNTALSEAQVNAAMVTVAGPPTFTGGNVAVTTGPNGPQFVLTWSGGTLLSATNVAGPFLPVAGATSPYTNILNSATPDMFFILSNP